MSSERIDDYRWLIGTEGERWLDRVVKEPLPLVRQAAALRREMSASRAHLVLGQTELRRRARRKFAEADRMFFTTVGLEQATDETVALYKAGRFPQTVPLADLCCGIGGDLLALAGRGAVLGVDRDPVTALIAEANLNVRCPIESGWRQRVRVADAAAIDLAGYAAWHIDPDRRPEGRRTTHVDLYQPAAATLDDLLRSVSSAAIKMAPAADPPGGWDSDAELEWISRGRECRQLVAWFGGLAERPGCRRATVLSGDGCGHLRSVWSLLGQASESVPTALRVGRYVFDPDPAVIAARLVALLAERRSLAAIGPGSVYLTGDEPLAEAGMGCFEVTDVLPFDRKHLRQVLSSRGIGQLEIKKRGAVDSPEQIRRQFRLRGDHSAVLLLTPLGGSVRAILARRVV